MPLVILVLEFELRKAHETIKALRGSLTEATGKKQDHTHKFVTAYQISLLNYNA